MAENIISGSLPEDRHEALLAARCASLAARLPILYCAVLLDVAVLATTFAGTVPSWLSIWLPLVLASLVGSRIVIWIGIRTGRRSVEASRKAFRLLPVSGVLFTCLLVTWTLLLYGYGSEDQRTVVHYMTAVTSFSTILGLTHAPMTSLVVALTVMVPTSVAFLTGDHPGRFTVVGVQTVVGMLLLLITRGHYRDFLALELSRLNLAQREREAQDLAERNRRQATCDELTGALNRRGFLEVFERCLTQPGAPLPWLAVLDLDGFKLINDTHGHAAGDAVLRTVSERIERYRGIAAAGRMGGDEFALVIGGHVDHNTVSELLDSLAAEIAQPVPFNGRKLAIRTSIGLHRCTATKVGDCLERADLALYKAKANHGLRLAEFTRDDEQVLADKRMITRVFTSADLEDQLAVVYQPIIDCGQHRTIGFEALARWSPDGQEWLTPSDFIRLAETTGRMSDLTAMIVSRTLAECPAWKHDLSLSINLSAHDILREDAAPWLAGLIDAAGAPHHHIVFEITETALLSDYRRAAETLGQLRSMGFRIALDDFGTGQSSLSHVHNLPLDHLKIDRSFADGLSTSPSARAIVGTIVTLARQLRLECVIEGIETAEQEMIARTLGLTMMQGFYFSRPVSAQEALSAARGDWLQPLTGAA